MSSNSHDKSQEKFLDEWLIEQSFPANIPLEMKVLTYLGYLGLKMDRLQELNPKKARGAPKKEITKNMLRADKFLSAKESLVKRGNKNPTNKAVIDFLIKAANALYDKKYISREERDLFTTVTPKSIQNKIKDGLRELEEFLKK